MARGRGRRLPPPSRVNPSQTGRDERGPVSRNVTTITVQPLQDRVIVLPGPVTTTISGLYFPESKEMPALGEVIAVGPGLRSEQTGVILPNPLEVGDQVVYSKFGGTELEIDGREVLILSARDVLARVGDSGDARAVSAGRGIPQPGHGIRQDVLISVTSDADVTDVKPAADVLVRRYGDAFVKVEPSRGFVAIHWSTRLGPSDLPALMTELVPKTATVSISIGNDIEIKGTVEDLEMKLVDDKDARVWVVQFVTDEYGYQWRRRADGAAQFGYVADQLESSALKLLLERTGTGALRKQLDQVLLDVLPEAADS